MVNKKEGAVDLHERMHKKLSHASSRGHVNEKEIYALSKEFFGELLKLDYEFTHEELIDELKKTYLEKKDLDQTVAFIRKIGVMEFTSNEYSQDELKTMLEELKTILNRLVHEEKKLSWLARLKQSLFGKKKKTEEEKTQSIGKEAVLAGLLEQLKKTPEGKEKQEIYKKAIITYELLDEEAKVMFYNDLLGIYYDLQHQPRPSQASLEAIAPQQTSDEPKEKPNEKQPEPVENETGNAAQEQTFEDESETTAEETAAGSVQQTIDELAQEQHKDESKASEESKRKLFSQPTINEAQPEQEEVPDIENPDLHS